MTEVCAERARAWPSTIFGIDLTLKRALEQACRIFEKKISKKNRREFRYTFHERQSIIILYYYQHHTQELT